MSLSTRHIGGNLECRCCHRRITGRQCRCLLSRRQIPRSEHTCAYPTRRSCGSRTSTPIKRVSMASRSLTTFAGRSSWCRSSSCPCRPTHSADGMTAAHVTLAADRPWNCHHSPSMPSQPGSVSASPLGSTSTTVCCASSTSNSSPKRIGRGSFFAACTYHGSSRRLAPAAGRARLTLQESVNFCSCASSTCAIASESHRIASGTWTRQLCAWFQQASVDGQKKTSQSVSSLRAPSSRSRSLRT